MTSQNISSTKSIMQTTNQTMLSISVRLRIITSSDTIVMLQKQKQITIPLKQKTSNHFCYQFKPSKQKKKYTQYTSG